MSPEGFTGGSIILSTMDKREVILSTTIIGIVGFFVYIAMVSINVVGLVYVGVSVVVGFTTIGIAVCRISSVIVWQVTVDIESDAVVGAGIRDVVDEHDIVRVNFIRVAVGFRGNKGIVILLARRSSEALNLVLGMMVGV